MTAGVFGTISPLKISSAIKREFVSQAKTLANGMLMIMCKTAEQQTKACKVKHFSDKSVEGLIPGSNGAKGVIYNVFYEISEEETV